MTTITDHLHQYSNNHYSLVSCNTCLPHQTDTAPPHCYHLYRKHSTASYSNNTKNKGTELIQ